MGTGVSDSAGSEGEFGLIVSSLTFTDSTTGRHASLNEQKGPTRLPSTATADSRDVDTSQKRQSA